MHIHMNKWKDQTIEIINLIFKILLISSIVGVALFKVIVTNIDLSSFDFSDFLSLLLALFAMGLSILFYFKATDTSNQFYDNSYKFTKEFSIILGRIEAGFGERLKHIDEGYSQIANYYKNPQTITEEEKKLEQSEEFVNKKEKEREEFIKSVLDRASFKDIEDKQRIVQQLEETRTELTKARIEINHLKSAIDKENDESSNVLQVRRRVIGFFKENYMDFFRNVSSGITDREIKSRFNSQLNHFHPEWLSDLEKIGWLNNEQQLTKLGILCIRNMIV